MCGDKEENLVHVLKCKQLRNIIEKHAGEEIEHWLGDREEDALYALIKEELKADPSVKLCELTRKFEKLAAEKGNNQDSAETRD